MENVVQLSVKLSMASTNKYYSPYELFEWPEVVDSNSWCFSPELMTIYGSELAQNLDEYQLKKLSFFEAVNFFSINIHGEKYLISKMVNYLYRDWPNEISDYLHHFIDEENKHMTLFGGFCAKYHKVYPDKTYAFHSELSQAEEDILFFSRMMIFEEFVDYYNVKMGKDLRLHEIVRAINLNHHIDEARHLVFGRNIIEYLLDYWQGELDKNKMKAIQQHISAYIQMVWKQYYNPSMYEDGGLENGYKLHQQLWSEEHATQLRREASFKCVEFLKKCSLLPSAGGDQ